jgi:hypothetical protein
MTREITLSVDLSADGTLTQVTAECADEATTVTIVNGRQLVPDVDALRGAFGRLLVEEHLGRCQSCQRGGA